MKKIKEEKGSMAIYVIVTLVSFCLILTGIYISTASARKAQIKTDIKIKEVYENSYTTKKEIDVIGEKEYNTPDGIPDKYQRTVTLSNSTGGVLFDGEQLAYIKIAVTLYNEKGELDENGTGRIKKEQLPEITAAPGRVLGFSEDYLFIDITEDIEIYLSTNAKPIDPDLDPDSPTP